MNRFLFTLLFLALTPHAAFGAPPGPCKILAGEHLLPAELQHERDAFVASMNWAGVPMLSKAVSGGNIPVILVNKRTVKKLAPMLDRSLGTMSQLQPGHGNDHGMMRVANKVMDIDSPGYRGYGELHQTGLAWKEVVGNSMRQSEDSPVRIEVNFLLTQPELKVAEYYQRIRRAAIFRVPFTFGGADIDMKKPNALESGGEHCFLFCKGSSVRQQVSAIEASMQKMGVANPRAYMNTPKMKEFLAEVQQQVLDWKVAFTKDDVTDTSFKNEAIANMTQGEGGAKLLEVYKDLFPAGMSAKDQVTLANWFIGHDASTQYQELMATLGITGGTGYSEMGNRRASFVLIYDYTNKAEAAFENGTYSTKGVFSSWTAQGQTPYVQPQN